MRWNREPRMLSWEIDQTLELPFVLEAMRQALQLATPEICNSDQHSQFTSPQWISLLQEAGVSISMDGKGGRRTISSSSACGARSSTRKYICTIMAARGRRGRGCPDTLSSIITAACIKPRITAHPGKSIREPAGSPPRGAVEHSNQPSPTLPRLPQCILTTALRLP